MADEIAVLVGEGKPLKDIFVLHAHARGGEQVIQVIDQQLGRCTVLNPKDSHSGNYVCVTTINVGTGLEALIVFLMGLHPFSE